MMLRRAIGSLVLGLLALTLAGRASSAVDPSMCSVGTHITLIGKLTDGTAPDGFGADSWAPPTPVTIRDGAGAPVSGAMVRIHFGSCVQSFPSPSQTTVYDINTICTSDPVLGLKTDANGKATFSIQGSTLHRGAFEPNSPSYGCAYATVEDPSNPGVEISLASNIRVSAVDQDGVNGVRATDLWSAQTDVFAIPTSHLERSDYVSDGILNVADLASLLACFLDGRSTKTAPRCDGVTANPTQAYVSGAGLLRLSITKCSTAPNSGSFALTCLPGSSNVHLLGTIMVPVFGGVAPIGGLEMSLDITGAVPGSNPPTLPDFWRWDALGCNSGWVTALDPLPTTGSQKTECYYPYPPYLQSPPYPSGSGSRATSGGAVDYPYPVGPNKGRLDMARIRLVSFPSPFSLGAAGSIMESTWPFSQATFNQYVAFALNIVQDPDPGLGCGGCTTPVAIQFKSVTITRAQGPTSDFPTLARTADDALPDIQIVASASDSASVIFLNGVPDGFQITGVAPSAPTIARLDACSPNPARDHTLIRFSLAQEGEASLMVFDLAGRRVRQLARGVMAAGEHSSAWDLRRDDGSRATHGTYFVRLRSADGLRTQTVIALD